MTRVLDEAVQFAFWFLIWTLWAYGTHRLAHFRSRSNPLARIHLAHHAVDYASARAVWPSWPHFFLWFGGLRASLDVWLTLTLPAACIALVSPRQGVAILAFHYVYEVFLSEGVLDHNGDVHGGFTRVFAWGQVHLLHHRKPRVNFGLIINFWDDVFDTFENVAAMGESVDARR